MDLLAASLPDFFHAIKDFFSAAHIESLMEAGGYAVLFGLLFACGLGLPLPEDIPLILAGVLIAKGQMHIVPAAIAAWCGIIGGDIALYHFGKKFGLEITRVRFVGKHLTRQRIEWMEQLFERYGIFVVAVGRLIAIVRGAMVVAAGAARFNFWKFIITDGIMAFISGGVFIWLGHLLGHIDEAAIKKWKHLFILGAVAIAAALLAWYLLKRRLALRAREKGFTPAEAKEVAVDKVVEKVAEKLVPQNPMPGTSERIPTPVGSESQPRHDG